VVARLERHLAQLTAAFSIILLLLGWASFLKLPVTRLPSADIPVVSVVVAQFGAAPAPTAARRTMTQRTRRSARLKPASAAGSTASRRSNAIRLAAEG